MLQFSPVIARGFGAVAWLMGFSAMHRQNFAKGAVLQRKMRTNAASFAGLAISAQFPLPLRRDAAS
ncbi:hypothetical protein ACFSM0_09730 [Rhodobacter lacus]|uniref:Uncharacterized protein n=1 Tax=Rhodobacter lacus TaxID=1641972 RepID=A0ABW5A870_9RHOB